MDSTILTEHDDETRLRAHKICCDHLGEAWSRISPYEMRLTPISGGMSNAVFCCSLPDSIVASDGEPTQVLLRLYGDQWRNCDMSIQLKIFEMLSFRGLGPKLYGNFEDGRLEEFLPASSLTCEELMDNDISSIVAKKLASVHSLEVPIDRKTTWLLDRLVEWANFVKERCEPPILNDETRQSTLEIAKKLLAIDYKEEIKFLRGILERTHSPKVFSHNDLHQGNILFAKSSKRRPTLEERIVLIDFEYCSYNYRAYDIANHFCEWCFEYDTPDYPHFTFFEDRFPSKESQLNFVRHYLNQQKLLLSSSSSSSSSSVSPSLRNCSSTSGNNNNNVLESIYNSNVCRTTTNGHSNGATHLPNGKFEDDEALLEEIKPFFMAANLLWTVWCIKSAQGSITKFGYWEHSMARWRLYSSFKESYFETLMTTRTNGNSTE